MLDETKGGNQDKSSGETGQTSGGKGGSTSKKGKTYTDAEIQKIRSDAAAEAGRLRKAAEQERDSLRESLQTTRSRLDAIESQMNESRLAEVRGDPDRLRSYQHEQTQTRRERELDDRESELSRREAQLKSDREEVDKDRSVVNIAYVAAKHGLETDDLESLGISDLDVLDKVAEKIAAGKPKDESNENEEEETEEPNTSSEELIPDSARTIGGAQTLTSESAEKMPISSLEKAIEKAESP